MSNRPCFTGLPDLDLSFLFVSFLGLSRDFAGIFPICSGDGPGIFLIRRFSLSRPIKSTYEEQSRKGPRHNLDLSRKSGTPPCLETPRFGFSQASGKKKAHKHKRFGPVALGTPRECPRDKLGLSPGQTGFVPGTNPGFLLILHSGSPVCPWDEPSLSLGHSGDEGRQTEFMC